MTDIQNSETGGFSVYCNSINISISIHDISFTLNERWGQEENKYLGKIFMSPQHAKALSRVLTENINKYEELFGVIPEITQARLEELKKQGFVLDKG